MDNLVFSKHARERMEERGVTDEEVYTALSHDKKITKRGAIFHFISSRKLKKENAENKEIKRAKQVTVVTNLECSTVLTVLERRKDNYERIMDWAESDTRLLSKTDKLWSEL